MAPWACGSSPPASSSCGATATSGPEEVLTGGVANAGAVVRVGDHVLRPSSPQTPGIHALLRWVRAHGFDGVPEPVGVDPDGRERLVHIAGDVPVPPFPAWSTTDDALASIARLLRRYHEAAAGFAWDGEWNTELADPEGGDLICHHDVCPENVVFRDGEAVAILDFEFAAPGRPLYDLASMVRLCAPVRPDAERVPERLRVAADAYGCDAAARAELLACLADQFRRAGAFVRRRMERGEPGFVAMWEDAGGETGYARRRAWFVEQHEVFAQGLS